MINILAVIGGLALGYVLITVLGIQPWILFVLTTIGMMLWLPMRRIFRARSSDPSDNKVDPAPTQTWFDAAKAKEEERRAEEAEQERKRLILNEARDVFNEHSEAALFLIREDEDTQISKSRIGGRPTLPAELDWPLEHDAPMHFLAEIHLDEVPRLTKLDALPDAGVLYFFMYLGEDADMVSGKVIYADAPGPALRQPPEDLEPLFCTPAFEKEDTCYPPHTVRAVEMPVLNRAEISTEICDQDVWLALSDVEQEVYQEQLAEIAKTSPVKLHGADHYIYSMIGGPKLDIPNPTSGTGIKLLQLDSDADLGLEFGDMGIVEFWIGEDDLRSRNLERVIVDSASC